MPLSTTDSINEVFRRAIREDLHKTLKTGDDWERYKTILRETDARLMTEQADHARSYTKRIAEAKEIILREENSIRLDQPLPSWATRHSDADALQSKAEARVRHDYDRRCATIKSDELDAFKDLAADIRAREAPEQTQSLTQTHTQGRSGPSRT